ncbi:MAG: 6-phosphogluconolactonase [Pseudomonadota bacterium]
MTHRFVEHASRAAQAEALADLVAADLQLAVEVGAASLAVPGGSTPKPFLEALADRALDWAAVMVTATDERWAPPTDARSNEAMIRAALRPRAFLPFWREGRAPEDAAPALAEDVARHLPFSSVVMGMGDDRHCASLFPGAPGLAAAFAADAPAVAAIRPGDGLEPRVTLTAPALAGAGRLRLLIAGAEKRKALDAALADPDPARSPVAAVLDMAARAEVHWAP